MHSKCFGVKYIMYLKPCWQGSQNGRSSTHVPFPASENPKLLGNCATVLLSSATYPRMHQIEIFDSNLIQNPHSEVRSVFAYILAIDLSLISVRALVAYVSSSHGRCLLLNRETTYKDRKIIASICWILLSLLTQLCSQLNSSS